MPKFKGGTGTPKATMIMATVFKGNFFSKFGNGDTLSAGFAIVIAVVSEIKIVIYIVLILKCTFEKLFVKSSFFQKNYITS